MGYWGASPEPRGWGHDRADRRTDGRDRRPARPAGARGSGRRRGDRGAGADHRARAAGAGRGGAAGRGARTAAAVHLIEEYLQGVSGSALPELDEAVRYSLLSGGKRVRPRLCLAAAAGAGADPRLALPAAAAVEMIHAFSLVHDDLPALDDDSERRGQPTSHVRYGEAVAVLVGDALLSAAYRHVAEHLDVPADVRLAVIAELAAGVEGMIDGQYLDVTASTPPTHDQLAELHRLKTGSLIGASVTTGALVGGIDRDQLGP